MPGGSAARVDRWCTQRTSACLTPELEHVCAGATVLIPWRRDVAAASVRRLAIGEALPPVCSWTVDSIMLTHIGRSAPPDSRLQREVAGQRPKASAAYNKLAVTI